MEEDERDALTRITVREVDPVDLGYHRAFLPISKTRLFLPFS
jgi:hypothetical protein